MYHRLREDFLPKGAQSLPFPSFLPLYVSILTSSSGGRESDVGRVEEVATHGRGRQEVARDAGAARNTSGEEIPVRNCSHSSNSATRSELANCVCASDCPTITLVGCLSREKKRYKTVEKLLDLLSIGASFQI